MLLRLTLLLLTGLSAYPVAGNGGEELALSIEAGPWVTVTLEEGNVPSIQFQLQEVKTGKASQFFGLMGKRAGGISPIQLVSITGHQTGQRVQGLLGRKEPSTEGTELSPDQEDEDQGSE
ncbi:tachykinin-4 [Dasypus novemcinctus]|uniref:tachykinin-4 n=1 Tax=Dasypus novemcinctus TaxID=9361 RepID=UPI000C8547CF|nr:tachykinin-4 [Dasypus novemcinctus]